MTQKGKTEKRAPPGHSEPLRRRISTDTPVSGALRKQKRAYAEILRCAQDDTRKVLTGRSPHLLFILTKVQGHGPCPRKRETHGGVHIKSSSSILVSPPRARRALTLGQLEDPLTDDVVLNLARACT